MGPDFSVPTGPENLDIVTPHWRRFAALLLVAGSLIIAAVVHHYGIELIGIVIRMGITAISEEFIFHRFIWDRMKRAGWGAPLIIVVNTSAVALWHIPALPTGLSQASVGGLAVLLLAGPILCTLRQTTQSLIIPTATHFAIDIF